MIECKNCQEIMEPLSPIDSGCQQPVYYLCITCQQVFYKKNESKIVGKAEKLSDLLSYIFNKEIKDTKCQ